MAGTLSAEALADAEEAWARGEEGQAEAEWVLVGLRELIAPLVEMAAWATCTVPAVAEGLGNAA